MPDEMRSGEVGAVHAPDANGVGHAYGALRSGAMLVDRSARTRMTLAGDKAAEVLTGLVTNDVPSLGPGHGQYAAALTPKGKVIADIRIFAREGELLIDAAERAKDGWWAMIRKYVNPRLAKYSDVSAALADIGLFGARARAVVSEAVGVDVVTLESLAPYGHHRGVFGGAPVLVARVPDLGGGVDGYEIFAPADAAPALRAQLLDQGAVAGDGEAFDIARIEAGRPEWGVDMDDTTLAQEANLDTLHAISYTKGCYTGQETVARVHFRGHVNRHLRGLRVEAPAPPPRGAELVDESGHPVGDVRSTARSPRLGAVALAMVRREVETGATVRVTWPEGSAHGSVVELPFPL